MIKTVLELELEQHLVSNMVPELVLELYIFKVTGTTLVCIVKDINEDCEDMVNAVQQQMYVFSIILKTHICS